MNRSTSWESLLLKLCEIIRIANFCQAFRLHYKSSFDWLAGDIQWKILKEREDIEIVRKIDYQNGYIFHGRMPWFHQNKVNELYNKSDNRTEYV